MLRRTQPRRSAPKQADAGVPIHGWRFIHRERPPCWPMVVYIHACTYVTLDESLNRAAKSPAVNPG
jgi:hypothetical protein